MKRDEFFQVLDKLFENSSVSEIRSALDSIEYSWVEQYWEEKSEGFIECDNCGEYVELEKCRKEEHSANTFLGRVSLRKYYCPECGKLAFEDSKYV